MRIGIGVLAAGKTMTLAELGQFVQQALRQDADPETPIRAVISLGGKLKALELEWTDRQVSIEDLHSMGFDG